MLSRRVETAKAALADAAASARLTVITRPNRLANACKDPFGEAGEICSARKLGNSADASALKRANAPLSQPGGLRRPTATIMWHARVVVPTPRR